MLTWSVWRVSPPAPPFRGGNAGQPAPSPAAFSTMPSTLIGRARASIPPPARLWSSSAMPCQTSVAWPRRSRHVPRLPDCGRWM
eukprot:7278175-Alexandrium_andersonii.AAC.1